MKKFAFATLLMAFTAASNSAFAGTNACDDFMKCGTYQGSGRSYDINNQVVPDSDYEEKIVLTSQGPLSINLKQSMWQPGRPDDLFYELDLEVIFQADGSYVAQYTKAAAQGKHAIFASGICQTGQVCSLAMIPFKWQQGDKSGVTGNVNILRFENGMLSRIMMAAAFEGDISYQRSQLSKK